MTLHEPLRSAFDTLKLQSASRLHRSYAAMIDIDPDLTRLARDSLTASRAAAARSPGGRHASRETPSATVVIGVAAGRWVAGIVKKTRMAAESGRSQADIIREAIGRTTRAIGPRRLRSAAVGHGDGAPVARDADEIVRAELGRSTR